MGAQENVQIDSFVYRVPTAPKSMLKVAMEAGGEETNSRQSLRLYALVEVNYRKSMGLGASFSSRSFFLSNLRLDCANFSFRASSRALAP